MSRGQSPESASSSASGSMPSTRSIAKALAGVVLAGLVVLAMIAGAFATGLLGAPSVVTTESRFGPIDSNETTVITNVTVENPNPIGLTGDDATVSQTVALNGITVASGSRQGISLPAGRSTNEIETAIDNSAIPRWWVSHVRRDERTTAVIDAQVRSSILGGNVTVSRERTIETQVLDGFNSTNTRAIEAPESVAALRSGPVLYLNRTSASWGEVNETATPIDVRLRVFNPLGVPIPISNLGYTVRMNGVPVGSGATDRLQVLEPGRTTTVEASVPIEAARLDEWWVRHVRNGQQTTIRVDFTARARLPVVGVVSLPLDGLGYRSNLTTDLLGNSDSVTNGSGTANTTAMGTSASMPAPVSARHSLRTHCLPFVNDRREGELRRW
jgi:LEA14-like dessication related protein